MAYILAAKRRNCVQARQWRTYLQRGRDTKKAGEASFLSLCRCAWSGRLRLSGTRAQKIQPCARRERLEGATGKVFLEGRAPTACYGRDAPLQRFRMKASVGRRDRQWMRGRAGQARQRNPGLLKPPSQSRNACQTNPSAQIGTRRRISFLTWLQPADPAPTA